MWRLQERMQQDRLFLAGFQQVETEHASSSPPTHPHLGRRVSRIWEVGELSKFVNERLGVCNDVVVVSLGNGQIYKGE